MKKENIEKIFEIFNEANPEPKTELNYTNNFTLLVAVVLSAQATDIGVNKATQKLFKIADTPQAILNLKLDNLKSYIKTIGLYNSKAINIIKLCKILVRDYNSVVPDNFEDLIKLPGVGVKTANVILNCAFGKPTIAVDTHVFRVSNRTGMVATNVAEKTEKELLKIIPEKYLRHAHHHLILHGRYICKARKPLCDECPIEKYCCKVGV